MSLKTMAPPTSTPLATGSQPADGKNEMQPIGLKGLFTLIYMVRVPVLALVAMAGLGFLANTIASSVLANLFDQGTSFWGVCAVCFFGFLLSAVSIVCINNVLIYGRARCGDGDIPAVDIHSRLAVIIGWCVLTIGAVPSFIFAGFVWHGTTQLSYPQKLGPTALAFSFAILAGLIAKAVQLALWDGMDSKQEFPPDLVIPLHPLLRRYKFYESLADWAPLRGLNNTLQPIMRWLWDRVGPGYFHEDACEPPKLQWNSGHMYVIGIYLLTFLLWVGFGKCKQWVLQYPDAPAAVQFLSSLPALAWVMIFLMVASMTLAGMSFFLDRYRIPFLWLIALLASVTGLTPKSDHFFHVRKLRASDKASYWTPGQILKSRMERGTKRFVIVSTAGGGIQAAAWTAKVLDGLGADAPQFRDSVLVISSVSGGSVGAMAYARSFDQANPPKTKFDPVRESEEGALDAAAWGWTVPDVWRAVEPWTRRELIDRGWAMERAWTRIFQLRSGRQETQLGDWALETHKTMPALILNSSIVETGHPVVFTTSSFADENAGQGATAAIYNFHNIYPLRPPYTYDVSIATATRLSAAFPFVAPAARPNLLRSGQPDFHYVDGGYYDNFGITTLFAWLEEATGETKCDDCQFLLLRITHFPDPTGSSTAKHGWLFQIYAPLQGLYDARDAGQLAGDNNQVRLEGALHSQISGASIQFRTRDTKCSDPPLSWQLSAGQKRCIEETWEGGSKRATNPTLFDARQCVAGFVSGKIPATCERMASEGMAAEADVVARPMPTKKQAPL